MYTNYPGGEVPERDLIVSVEPSPIGPFGGLNTNSSSGKLHTNTNSSGRKPETPLWHNQGSG